MMLRNLIDEMMRRRLLPVAAVAVLVAVIAPLLFLKGTPEGAPSADSAAPAAATPAKLPARAARLLTANDGDASKGSAQGTAHDPFNPPAAVLAAAYSAANPAAASTSSDASKSSGANTSTSSSSVSTAQPSPVVVKNPGSSPRSTAPKSNPSTSISNARTVSVDIRYGKKKDTKIRRAIPRYQAFYIHGKLVAVFVKYSPSRKKAVFAVAPGLHISGPIKCRVQDGACKYLDIPAAALDRARDVQAGSHAWLTMITANKTVVTRRLDVVHTKARESSASTKATAASTRSEQACLLGKLVAMKPGDPLVDRDSCES